MKPLNEWLAEHVVMLRTLSVHTAAEKALLKLAALPAPTACEIRQRNKIAATERTCERAKQKYAEVTSMLRAVRNTEKAAAKRNRRNNLITAGELLVSAGLLSDETGLPHLDYATLLGAYIGLANLEPDHPKFADWKVKGQARLDKVDPVRTDKESKAVSEMKSSDIDEAIIAAGNDDDFDDAVLPPIEELLGPDSDQTDDDVTPPDV